jgi:hypothetical protein
MIAIARRPVSSSAVISVGYSARAHLLDIEYRTGRVYRYRRVPAGDYRALLRAPSIGQFVNLRIKPVYTDCIRLA